MQEAKLPISAEQSLVGTSSIALKDFAVSSIFSAVQIPPVRFILLAKCSVLDWSMVGVHPMQKSIGSWTKFGPADWVRSTNLSDEPCAMRLGIEATHDAVKRAWI
jgi:hypothetical protein